MTPVTPSIADARELLRHTTTPATAPTRDGADQSTDPRSTPSLDALGRRIAQLQERAGAAVRELAQDTGSFAQDSALALRGRATRAGKAGTGFVRAHPLRSLLVAAGAGALLATLLLRARVRTR